MDQPTLPAGEELDWLVLHHVFDWKKGVRSFGEAPYRCGTTEHPALLPVSSDIAAAWTVIAYLKDRGLDVVLTGAASSPVPWTVSVSAPGGRAVNASGDTAPLAIARCAMKAVEAALVFKSSRP